MKNVAGIYLPDGEAHLPEYLVNSGGVYQPRQLNRSLMFVMNWELAIDIGAHVGMWSQHLVQKFQRVIAFEPMPQMRACLDRNVASERLQVIPIALGNEHGAVSFHYDEAHTGATHIESKIGLIPIGRLDDFPPGSVTHLRLPVAFDDPLRPHYRRGLPLAIGRDSTEQLLNTVKLALHQQTPTD